MKIGYQGISQTSILSEVTAVITMESDNRIEDEYKTMDERNGYLKTLLIKRKWLHRWIGWYVRLIGVEDSLKLDAWILG